MNKSALKKFAQFARTKLIADMKQQISYWQKAKEVSGGLQTVDGNIVNGEHTRARQSMTNELVKKSVDELAEQAGYTWFNRIMAIKFMEHHRHLPTTASWFSNDDGSEYPEIVHDAVHQAQLIGMDTSKVDSLYQSHHYEEVYRELFIGLCNSLHDSLGFLFERIDDWSMLLFPQQLMGPSHIIKHEKQGLLTIPEEDRQEVEVIGWMYQYYISEKKDDLFDQAKKKKQKFGAEELPAVTQLFTPKWIVEYMVHNTVGKTWLQNNPDEELQKKRQFLIEVNPDSEHITIHDPKEITVLDPACGSGHILVTSYDVLYDIYLQAGYTRSSIPQLILQNNLFGFEICPRAHQLACFAVTMKARQDDPDISKKVDIAHHIICLEENNNYEQIDEQKYPHLRSFLKNWYKAHTYGSLIHVEEFAKEQVLSEYETFQSQDGLFADSIVRKESLDKMLRQAELMLQKYANVVANPPYMGGGNMDTDIKQYITLHYPDLKSDLFAPFVYRCLEFGAESCKTGFVTPFVWMFIKSFEWLRNYLIDNTHIASLVKPSYTAFFESAIVPLCSYCIEKHSTDAEGVYFDLGYLGSAESQPKLFLEGIHHKESVDYRYERNQENFTKIPGSPIAYQVSDNIFKAFDNKPLGNQEIGNFGEGLSSKNNDKFLRLWQEVSYLNIEFDSTSHDIAKKSQRKWFPITKGGGFRKRYGNNEYTVNFGNDAKDLRDYGKSSLSNSRNYFKEIITWTKISSSNFSCRYISGGMIYSDAGPGGIIKGANVLYILGLLNSIVSFRILKSINPTLNYTAGNVSSIPFKESNNKDRIIEICNLCIIISKNDRNKYETSRNFQQFPLIEYKQVTLEESYQEFCKIRTEKFFELHANEEELNLEFIKIYGLEDELTPDVPLAEITILQEELDSKKLKEQEESIKETKKLPWKRAIIAEQLMSYMLGCMMGRYSLDHGGLVYAGGEYDSSKYTTFPADEDGIIPVLDDEYFTDDIVNRTKEFVKNIRGKTSFTQNWSWLAQALGGTRNQSADEVIRNYWRKSFSDDHFKRYKKRPIYRYFSSNEKKGKGVFQAIVYLHRYDKDTISRIRNTYLDKFQRKVHNMIEHQESRKKEELDTKKLAQIEKELKTLQEMQTELAQYDERLKHVAEERIELDLDDGVKENYGLMMDKGLVVKYKL